MWADTPCCVRLRRSPLPVLFMRFVIQALAAAPKLRAFVLDILSTLVRCARLIHPDRARRRRKEAVCSNAGPGTCPPLSGNCLRAEICGGIAFDAVPC